MSTVITLDQRRRAPLAFLTDVQPGATYLVDADPDGTITLTPARTLAEHEIALLARPELVARILANIADTNRLVELDLDDL